MKLIGSRRKSKHLTKGQGTAKKSKWSGYTKKKKIIIVTSIVLCTIALLLGSLFAIIRWEIQPFFDLFFPMPGHEQLGGPRTPRPPVDSTNPGNPEDTTPDPRHHDADGNPLPLDKIRNMNIITFMMFGIDNDANTDVIMVGAFDTEEHTIEIVSIPRDTLMNSPWESVYYAKKANFIQPRMRRDHPSTSEGYALAMDDTLDHFEALFGFNIDFWFTVNMQAFVTLVDSIDGVKFNVPFAFDWTDTNDRTIHIAEGNQVLDGARALAVLRQRYNQAGVNYGDLWRITNQQAFLKSAAEQILSSRNFNITSMADIFLRHVRTDIQLDNLVRLGREFLKVDSSNINFTTLPGEGVFRWEYWAVNVDEWLEIVNTKLNPFNYDIEVNDVSILTLNSDRKLYVTDGDWQGSRDWLPNNWQP